jgi:phage FluMu protein Com
VVEGAGKASLTQWRHYQAPEQLASTRWYVEGVPENTPKASEVGDLARLSELLDCVHAEVKQVRCTYCGAEAEPLGLLVGSKPIPVLKCPRCKRVWEVGIPSPAGNAKPSGGE